MKKLLSFLMTLLLFVSCGDETDGTGDGSLSLAKGIPTKQMVAADVAQPSKGIAFTSTINWKAEVRDLSASEGSEANWIALDKYSGGPGNVVLHPTLEENFTGENRKAEILISGGSSSIAVVIEQTTLNENGEEHEVHGKITVDGKKPWIKFDPKDLTLKGSYEKDNHIFSFELESNLLYPQWVEIKKDSTEQDPNLTDFMTFLSCERLGADQVEASKGAIRYRADFEVWPNTTGQNRFFEVGVYDQYQQEKVEVLRFEQLPGTYCEVAEVLAKPRQVVLTLNVLNVDELKYYVSENFYNDFDHVDENDCYAPEMQPNQKTVKLHSLKPLEPNKKYYFHVKTVNHDLNMVATFDFEVNTPPLGSENDLVVQMIASRANDYTLTLLEEQDFKGTIDWGDGTVEEISEWKKKGYSHTYKVSEPTAFDIRLRGWLPRLCIEYNNALTAIKQWGDVQMKNVSLKCCKNLKSIANDTLGSFRYVEHFGEEKFGGAFEACGIERIPEGFFKYAVSATKFERVFADCEKLKAIPDYLFKDSKSTSFCRAFLNCDQLTEIPAHIFEGCERCKSFELTFGYCDRLTVIPSGLFDDAKEAVHFEGTFMNCPLLTTIPEGLFAKNVHALYFGRSKYRYEHDFEGGEGVFEECSSLTEIPANLFAYNTEASDFSRIFYNCTALTEIPEGLFDHNPKMTSIHHAFRYCKNLKAIPNSLFDNNRKVNDISFTFADCTALTGESPFTVIEGKKVHLYERKDYPFEFEEPVQYDGCFMKDVLLTDFKDLPPHWN